MTLHENPGSKTEAAGKLIGASYVAQQSPRERILLLKWDEPMNPCQPAGKEISTGRLQIQGGAPFTLAAMSGGEKTLFYYCYRCIYVHVCVYMYVYMYM